VKPRALVVAVDGPSGSGKSSVSRGVAARLGLRYLDTGALYRAATWQVLTVGVDLTDDSAIAAAVAESVITAGTDPDHPAISVGGRDVSVAIRGPEVTAAVSRVSAVPEVRSRLLVLQRDLIGAGGIVVEGRDIGTVVAPDAALKVFLTADAAVRGQRRHAETAHHDDAAKTAAALQARDRLDSSREASPLRAADDAVTVDATDLTLADVIDTVCALISERAGSPA
jgi:cytidylate kinase